MQIFPTYETSLIYMQGETYHQGTSRLIYIVTSQGTIAMMVDK